MYEVGNTVHSVSQNEKSEGFAKMIVRNAELVEPVFREMILRRFVLGEEGGSEIFEEYCNAVGTDYGSDVRMLIIKPEGGRLEKESVFLKNRIETVRRGTADLMLYAAVDGHVLVITDILEKNRITSFLEKIRAAVKKHSGCDTAAVYSDVFALAAAREKYAGLLICLDGLFYTDNSKILSENDIIERRALDEHPDCPSFEERLRKGDTEGAKAFLNEFFGQLERVRPPSETAKRYCLQLYISILRCCGASSPDKYIDGENEIRSAESLSRIRRLMLEAAAEAASMNKPKDTKIYSSLIKDTISTIDKNIENENLSLRWLAGTILYTNVDYLGKLFKKETGKNFSHYVMEKRMEMAKELILEGKKDRIYEVAEKVGYGSNSQYFSQVFKKYTGVSPLEYKEFARLMRQKAKE